MKKVVRSLVGLAAAILATGLAHAQNAIESIAATNQAGRIMLRVQMKEPLNAVPPSFTIAQPARIAFDFANAVNATGRPTVDLNEGELRSASMVQVGNRTRLVLNLAALPVYEAQVDGRNLIINLTSNASAVSRTRGQVERFAEEKGGAKPHAIKDIDFRRGPNGEGRVVIELADTTTGIDIRTQGPNLVVDFLRTNLPDNLRKRLNVTDFATPVQIVNTFPQGANTRMVIEPKGLWEHNAYQTDTQFVIEVKPVQFDPNKLVQGSRGGYKGEKLSLNIQNIAVREALNIIADFTDLNIIASDSVQGSLTLRLREVPWDQALDIILQARGLDMRKNGNVIWIAPREELAVREKLELEAKQQIADLEPLRTETFQLNYTKAAELLKLLSDQNQRILSKRGSAVVDPRTNQIFVQDVTGRLEEVRRIVSKVDVPVRQVMIEARIVEATDTFARTLGARLGVNSLHATNPNAFVGGGIQNAGFQTGQVDGTTRPDFLQNTNVNLPAPVAAAGTQNGAIALTLFNSARTRFLNLELSALESDRKGKVISSPRVVTADQTEASIEQGEEIPFQQAAASGATAITFRKAVLSLRVKPQITPDGNVIMDVIVNKDSRGQPTPGGFAIDTKNVRTSVLVENGGTVVIGGIYQQDESQQVNKIPFLGDLPGVGPLFRNNLRRDAKTELLVFLTPRIVDDRLSLR